LPKNETEENEIVDKVTNAFELGRTREI